MELYPTASWVYAHPVHSLRTRNMIPFLSASVSCTVVIGGCKENTGLMVGNIAPLPAITSSLISIPAHSLSLRFVPHSQDICSCPSTPPALPPLPAFPAFALANCSVVWCGVCGVGRGKGKIH
eukprot:GGOE01003468.1.p3 GENE.GGOE01003468.1~~GGOE01003468.1.p3  ORF type:complete len:123 (-),score=3.16 GGOE01003468.1:37-405(-)